MNNVVTYVKHACDLKKWHSILGHCNQNDIVNLEKVVHGMKINNKDRFICDPCILGKNTQSKNKMPAVCAKFPLEMISSDLCRPMDPISRDGFKYDISFIDNYSVFVYCIKQKSDATKALNFFYLMLLLLVKLDVF